MEQDKHTPLRVGLVEDHAIFRKRLVELLGFYDQLEVVMAAESARSFIDRLDQAEPFEQPQVILMDIELPDLTGIDATALIKERHPDLDIIMFTVFEDDDRIFDSIKAGAAGYLLKDTPIDEVVNAIIEIRQGGSPISPTIARKVMQMMQGISRDDAGLAKEAEEAPYGLTPAEIRILKQVISGKTNKEIAEELFLSPWTVKTHIRNIYKKMQVSSRAAAVRLALGRDLG